MKQHVHSVCRRLTMMTQRNVASPGHEPLGSLELRKRNGHRMGCYKSRRALRALMK